MTDNGNGIQRSDIISDEAIQAPLEAAKNVDAASKSYDNLIQKTKDLVKANDMEADSIISLNQLLVNLTQKEQDLVDLQNRHSIEVKKLVETQKQQAAQISDLNKKLKEKQETEEKSSKAIETLDRKTGGYISSLKEMKAELIAIAKSPIAIFLGVLAGAFFALKESADLYYKTTGEGEDMLADKIAGTDAALAVLKNRWADLNKEANQGKDKSGAWWMDPRIMNLLPQNLQKSLRAAYQEGVKLNREADALGDEIIEHSLEKEQHSLEVSGLLYQLTQKQNLSLNQQLEMRTKISDIREGDMLKELSFAEREFQALEKHLALTHSISLEAFNQLDAEGKKALLTEPEYKAWYDAQVKMVSIRKNYFEEERKNKAAIDAIYAQADKDRIDATKKQTKEEEDAMKAKADAQYEYDKMQEEKEKEMYDEWKKKEDDRKAYLKKNAEDIKEMFEDIYGNSSGSPWGVSENFKDDLETDLEDILRLAGQFTSAMGNLFSNLSAGRMQDLEAERTQIEKDYNDRLAAVKYSAAFTKAIEEEKAMKLAAFEKKKREELRKTAIYEKAAALASAAINIALAITRVAWSPFQVIATSIIGAVQLAAIAAKPIPQLFRGSRNFGGGPAWVGERGTELVNVPGGRSFLTPDNQTLMHLPPGTEVIPHEQTVALMKERGLSIDTTGIERVMSQNKQPDFMRIGRDMFEVKKYKDGSKTYVRKHIFG